MKLLLDTHAFLWFCEGDSQLSQSAREAIEDRENSKHVSHASAWEAAIKVSLGKLKLSVPYEEIFPGAVSSNGFIDLPTCHEHFRLLTSLPFHHRDPFDRLLVVQAMHHSLTIITRDPIFPRYGVLVLW